MTETLPWFDEVYITLKARANAACNGSQERSAYKNAATLHKNIGATAARKYEERWIARAAATIPPLDARDRRAEIAAEILELYDELSK